MAEHQDNVIHTDEGARAAGHPAALVAGTTVYSYLTHPPAFEWGREWIDNGGAEVRFRAPVFDDDLITCAPLMAESDAAVTIDAVVDGSVRATLLAWRRGTAPAPPIGDRLATTTVAIDNELGLYGLRAGDDLEIYRDEGIAHPAIWPCIGNRVTKANFVTGPWIHVRSKVAHLGAATLGDRARIESTLVNRFDSRAGERVVVDVRVSIDGSPVAAIEHESIIRLA